MWKQSFQFSTTVVKLQWKGRSNRSFIPYRDVHPRTKCTTATLFYPLVGDWILRGGLCTQKQMWACSQFLFIKVDKVHFHIMKKQLLLLNSYSSHTTYSQYTIFTCKYAVRLQLASALLIGGLLLFTALEWTCPPLSPCFTFFFAFEINHWTGEI